jgi:hypothetical protein
LASFPILGRRPRSPRARVHCWPSVHVAAGLWPLANSRVRVVPHGVSAWRWPAPVGCGLALVVACAPLSTVLHLGPRRGHGCRCVAIVALAPLFDSPTASSLWTYALLPCLVDPITMTMGHLPALLCCRPTPATPLGLAAPCRVRRAKPFPSRQLHHVLACHQPEPPHLNCSTRLCDLPIRTTLSHRPLPVLITTLALHNVDPHASA